MKTIVNVCGASLSGTTMMDLILGNSDNAFSLGEVYAWFRPFLPHHAKISCNCDNNKPCPHWASIKDLPENTFHRNTFDHLGVEFLIDSSKEIHWLNDVNRWYAQNETVTLYNILLFKDPVSYAYSLWKRNKDIKCSLSAYKKYYQQFFDLNLPYKAVNYNKFVNSPEQYCKSICQYIRMDYFHGKSHFWKKQHHHLFGSSGTRKQAQKNEGEIIRTLSEHPEAFKVLLPSIEKQLRKDKALCKVITILNDNEII